MRLQDCLQHCPARQADSLCLSLAADLYHVTVFPSQVSLRNRVLILFDWMKAKVRKRPLAVLF